MDGVVQCAHGIVQNWVHSKDAPFILDSVGASHVEIDGEASGLPPGTIVVGGNKHLGLDGGGETIRLGPVLNRRGSDRDRWGFFFSACPVCRCSIGAAV